MTHASYKALVKPVVQLRPNEIQSIIELYLMHYDGSSRERVTADLKRKNEILLLFHVDTFVGFTTFELYDICFNGKISRIIYSGDTVVDFRHWGQQTLAFTWVKRLGELYRQCGKIPFYWFLIVKGHRTYRYLPAFARSFYPHWHINRQDLKPLLDYLATEKFADAYCRDTGVIHFANPRGYLKPAFAYPNEQEMRHEAVRFFMAKNPNYTRGDELACLCEISKDNCKPFTKRLINSGLKS